jgi:hypothetical protein
MGHPQILRGDRVLALQFLPVTNKGVPHISLVFREMWETTAVSSKVFNF